MKCGKLKLTWNVSDNQRNEDGISNEYCNSKRYFRIFNEFLNEILRSITLAYSSCFGGHGCRSRRTDDLGEKTTSQEFGNWIPLLFKTQRFIVLKIWRNNPDLFEVEQKGPQFFLCLKRPLNYQKQNYSAISVNKQHNQAPDSKNQTKKTLIYQNLNKEALYLFFSLKGPLNYQKQHKNV